MNPFECYSIFLFQLIAYSSLSTLYFIPSTYYIDLPQISINQLFIFYLIQMFQVFSLNIKFVAGKYRC